VLTECGEVCALLYGFQGRREAGATHFVKVITLCQQSGVAL
jgi:hypothetical protein